MALIGFGSVALLLAVEAVAPGGRHRQQRAERRLHEVASAVRASFRRDGRFARDLTEVARAAGVERVDAWCADPCRPSEQLAYRDAGAVRELRSRGADGELRTSDDLRVLTLGETQVRVRQRLRLRMLRAVLLQSPYRRAESMSAAEVARMRRAANRCAAARRSWWTAGPERRRALTRRMQKCAKVVLELAERHGLPPVPRRLTGRRGLMRRLSMQDARAVDGAGAALVADPVLGFVAAGSDQMRGTDDDM